MMILLKGPLPKSFRCYVDISGLVLDVHSGETRN